jgi:restriction endonuclease S subunit
VRPGHKRTEVGVIPEGWEVSTLGDLAVKVGSGITPTGGQRVYRGDGRPFVRSQNVGWGQLLLDDIAFIDDSTHATFPATELLCGDVLLNITGASIGRSAVADWRLAGGNVNQHVCIIRSDTQLLAPQYLNLCLISAGGRSQIDSFQAGGNRQGLNFRQVRSIQVPLPPLAEQRAIAAALSDVDALLAGLSRLIAKKRDLKQATMQRLLTGETRLPGFNGDWQVKRLGDVATCFAGGTPPTRVAAYYAGDIPWITSGDLNKEYITDVEGRISEAGLAASAAQMVEANTLLIALYGATSGIAAISKIPAAINQAVLAIIPRKDNTKFLYFMLRSRKKWLISTYTQGGQPNLSGELVKSMQALLPSVPEQTAIASVLSDADAELAALEARRDKTRALKQAMMQALLSGKTRLVEPVMVANAVDSAKRNGRPANVYFKRSVLAAEIVDRLHEEPTFGHVKFEKMIFLVEHLCAVDTGSSYHRDAAGPYDNRAMRSIDSQLRKQKWFDAQELNGRYRYLPMAKRGGHKEYFERYFGGVRDSFERTVSTLRTFDTERCEIIATLFAAWNDLMDQHASASDETIVHEVLNNWHESKKRIPEERWRKALSWMRDNGFVPHQATGELS